MPRSNLTSNQNEKSSPPEEAKGISRRGFAAMDPERAREIRSKGGKAVQAQGKGHQWTQDEAREAGRKGGSITSQDRERMSEIGRKGGEGKGRKNAKA